jgi:hypothetical protein
MVAIHMKATGGTVQDLLSVSVLITAAYPTICLLLRLPDGLQAFCPFVGWAKYQKESNYIHAK